MIWMSFVFGSHERMRGLERRIGFIARSRLPVLIEGASGTGKETLAELIHDLSGLGNGITKILCRQSGPMAYPASPTGSGVPGLSAVCRGTNGTLFLKNVHLLSPDLQDELLGALEQMSDFDHEPVRGLRVVSSTSEALEPLVSRRALNPGLYHRLSVYRIYLPPLRERREDIPELFDMMVTKATNGHGAPPPPTAEILSVLMSYDWPGNLRELHNIAQTYVAGAPAEEIIAELSSRSGLLPSKPAVESGVRSLKEQVKGASLKLEAEIILRALERHRWNRRRAAESLQISYRSLLYKMKSCDLRFQPQAAPEGKRDLYEAD